MTTEMTTTAHTCHTLCITLLLARWVVLKRWHGLLLLLQKQPVTGALGAKTTKQHTSHRQSSGHSSKLLHHPAHHPLASCSAWRAWRSVVHHWISKIKINTQRHTLAPSPCCRSAAAAAVDARRGATNRHHHKQSSSVRAHLCCDLVDIRAGLTTVAQLFGKVTELHCTIQQQQQHGSGSKCMLVVWPAA